MIGPGLEIGPQRAPGPERPIQSADRSPATWVAPTQPLATQMKQVPAGEESGKRNPIQKPEFEEQLTIQKMEAAARSLFHEFFKAWEIYPPDVR